MQHPGFQWTLPHYIRQSSRWDSTGNWKTMIEIKYLCEFNLNKEDDFEKTKCWPKKCFVMRGSWGRRGGKTGRQTSHCWNCLSLHTKEAARLCWNHWNQSLEFFRTSKPWLERLGAHFATSKVFFLFAFFQSFKKKILIIIRICSFFCFIFHYVSFFTHLFDLRVHHEALQLTTALITIITSHHWLTLGL